MQIIIKDFETVETYLEQYDKEAEIKINGNKMLVIHDNGVSNLSICFELLNNGDSDFLSAIYTTRD